MFVKDLKKISLGKRGVEECEKITMYDIESFILKNKSILKKSARTCNNYIASIRLFLKFCYMQGRGVIDYKRVLFWKENRKKIWFLTEEEVSKIMNYLKADKTMDDLTKVRNQCMCSLLLHTGLRVSELNNIKIADVEEELQIIGKWWELRVVYLFNEHLQLLNLYLFLRKAQHIKGEYLFISHSNNSKWRKLSRNSIAHIISNIAKKAGIEKDVYPHLLRHTFATNILRNWGNVYYIQRLLGHKNITTTQLYLDATNVDLIKTQRLSMF